jgi:hypothetical protein
LTLSNYQLNMCKNKYIETLAKTENKICKIISAEDLHKLFSKDWIHRVFLGRYLIMYPVKWQ